MKPVQLILRAFSLIALTLLTTNVARADYPLYDTEDDYTTYFDYYKDFRVTVKSPSSAQGVVYVDMAKSDKNAKNPTSHTGPGATSTIEANFSGTSSYECFLYAYPKPGYALDGFVTKANYDAGLKGATYFLRNNKGEIYRSGDYVPFAKVATDDPDSNPTKNDSYRFSAAETVECYAIFRKAVSQTVNVKTPGTLENVVTNSANGIEVDNLIVKGTINEIDIKFLKLMATNHHLIRLDLSEAKIAEIPDEAFRACKFLYEVKLPKQGLLRIGNNAFAACRSLKAVAVPASVKLVADNAFSNCFSKDFKLP